MTPFKSKFAVLLLSILAFQSCVESSDSTKETDEAITKTEMDPEKSNIVSVGDALFSVPSPVQTALLIDSSGADYDASLPNSIQNLNNYVSDFDKSLVMGVYGADLAYTSIFQMNQEAIGYLSAVENLANDLDLSNALDKSVVKRFSQNLSHRDSMLVLSSLFFRASDSYLKENDRNETAALVLVGGWLEGMYLAYNSVESNENVRQRIAEQKITLDNILGLLNSLEQNDQLTKLHDQLEGLKTEFDNVNTNYEYQRPEVKTDEKLTVIKSKSVYEMSDEQLNAIGTQLESIRNNIVG